MKDMKNLEELLLQLDDAQDDEAAERVAKKILTLDAANPMAALALWELIDDEEEAFGKINVLLLALEEARSRIDKDAGDERLLETFGQIVMRLAAAYLLASDYAGALAYADELVSIDPDDYFSSRTYYFCALLGLKDFDRIIQEADIANDLTPAALHALAIALFEKGDRAGAREALIAAFELDIELPFYITGLIPDDEDEDLSEDELFDSYSRIIDANFLEEHWFYSDERTDFLARPLAVVGLLTQRIDLDEAKDITDDEEILNKAAEGAKKLSAHDEDIDGGALEMLKEIWQ